MSVSTQLFRGVCASTATTRDDNGVFDSGRLRSHVDWLLADGADAISPLGSAGEFPALEVSDRKRVIEAAVAAARGRVPVVAGTHHYSTKVALELSKHAEGAGADALLITPPYYMSPTTTQVMDHYRRVADAVSIPIVLYHNAGRTGVDLKTEELTTLFREGVIRGVKMSNSDPDRICELIQATDGSLFVYAGIDTVAFEGLCHGAVGWISGIPSIVPGAAKRLYTSISVERNLAQARVVWKTLAPLMRLIFRRWLGKGEGPHWLSVMNAAWNLSGPPVGDPAPPVGRLEGEPLAYLTGILQSLGYALDSRGTALEKQR